MNRHIPYTVTRKGRIAHVLLRAADIGVQLGEVMNPADWADCIRDRRCYYCGEDAPVLWRYCNSTRPACAACATAKGMYVRSSSWCMEITDEHAVAAAQVVDVLPPDHRQRAPEHDDLVCWGRWCGTPGQIDELWTRYGRQHGDPGLFEPGPGAVPRCSCGALWTRFGCSAACGLVETTCSCGHPSSAHVLPFDGCAAPGCDCTVSREVLEGRTELADDLPWLDPVEAVRSLRGEG